MLLIMSWCLAYSASLLTSASALSSLYHVYHPFRFFGTYVSLSAYFVVDFCHYRYLKPWLNIYFKPFFH
ncbi:hypothetical protein M758_6G161400 [Ceratodon purpureus]|uniref:Secreted peptide n=1 Tax=Ceratodon purpureus TaxID=3225 RepID=A0A8T0HFG8_CERPU|nr:hypothetical protein KC19_6G167800 [Ceratodon purpureus]KAG0614238.1 hypothetical protein M758_6G161400 [Ceratodon purpureus]